MQGIMICKNHLCGLLLNSKLASKVFNSIVKCLATIIYVKSNYFEQHIKNIKYILNNLLQWSFAMNYILKRSINYFLHIARLFGCC